MADGPRAATRDREGAVRPGEELPVAAVDAWLKARLPELAGESLPDVTQYSGGVSNWTYRLAYPRADLVLRRPPAGTKAKSAHDMGREYRLQKALATVFPFVAEMVAFGDDPSVIGAEFYVMRRVPGLILRNRMAEPPDAATARRISEAAVDTLAALHAVDPAAAGLSDLGRGTGYARRQIEGWSDRWAKARTWNVPRFSRVIAWLKANAPEDAATCVIHGDFRLDNLVLDPDDPSRVRAVLDWELATLGCPFMDLGSALSYWVQADDDVVLRATRRQPTHLPGMLTRAEFKARYAEKAGRAPANWTFYEVYGVFRLAVIAQQIYYRYHRRETRNPAFRWFWLLAHYLERRCERLIRRG